MDDPDVWYRDWRGDRAPDHWRVLATSRLTHLTPHDFFGIAFWIGFSITLLGAEAWVDYTSTRRPTRRDAQRPA